MTCPRCNGPADEATLREFGGVCPKCLLQFSEEQDAPAFPNLEIIEMIGQGGMGVVYKARQRNLDRLVALKVLSPHLSDDPEFVERFTREAKALAQLSHPNIVGIYDSGIHDHVPYLVMEYIDGTQLRNAMGGGKLTPTRALEVIPQICDALQYAHANGIVHRDIKPENILIDRQGRVKIADFGLAKLSVDQSKLTQSGFVMGTPRYMAPEQFEASGQVDHRADIYSLGVVFYEMLTGEVPMGRFKPPSAKAGVDQRLDPVVLKSLEREPKDRYQSANEVKQEVAGLHGRKIAPAPGPRESHGLRKTALIFAGIGVAALLPGVIFSLISGSVSWSMLLPGLMLLGLAGVFRIVGLFADRPKPSAGSSSIPILGCLLVIVFGIAALGVLAAFFLVARQARSPVAIPTLPPPRPPSITSIHLAWNQELKNAGEPLGVMTGPHSFLAVTKKGIRELDPDSGRLLSTWTGPVDALPILEGEALVVWGGGKLTTFESRPNKLTALHTLDLPLDGAVSGMTLREGAAYIAMTQGAALAVEISTGKIRWEKRQLNVTAPLIGAPVVTSLDILVFSAGGSEMLDRERGGSKIWTQGGGGAPLMLQWDEGWATLSRSSEVECKTYYKRGRNLWYQLNTKSTADLDQCSMVFAGKMLVFTTINEIHGLKYGAPFSGTWSKDCPRTLGPAAPFGTERVAVPTVQGVLFYRVGDGSQDFGIDWSQSQTSVACREPQVLLLDHDRARLSCYKVETDQPRKR
jgi:tRNA A-37 threonylcarbamoyl transferase component Bud32